MLNHYRYPFRFYFLSALIPWSCWFLAAYFSRMEHAASQYSFLISALGFAGLCSPLLVAAGLIAKDKRLVEDVRNRLWNTKTANRRYVLMSLFIMPASILLAMAVSLLFGYDSNQFIITGHANFSSSVFPVWFLLVVAPILEELAWHSYGTDTLRQRFNLFASSMIFAVYWGLWHVPLALIQGYYHANLIFDGAIYAINFLVSIFPFVLLMNWLYYKSDRNIFVAIALHLTANVFNEVFSTHPDSKIIQTVILSVLAVYLVVSNRNFFFDKQFERKSHDLLPAH